MKKRVRKILPPFLICIVAIAAVFIGITYFNFISQRIFEDSTSHLAEIYGQVNRSFGAFIDRNWGLLDSCDDYFTLAGKKNGSKVSDYITSKKEYWGFSEFYFLSGDKTCMTPDGTKAEIDLGDSWDTLMGKKEPVMAGEKLADGREVTIFAVPIQHETYNGFGFDAIAVSYTNADLANSLNVDAFAGKAKCFVIHRDGSVLLSTQAGGNVFSNYLVYLKAASDLDETRLAQIQDDWNDQTSGLIQCSIGDVTHCILYEPIGYQDYILLSAVPQNVLSAGFLSVQKATLYVLIAIFLLAGAIVITLIIQRSLAQSRKSKTELQYRERMFDVLSNSVDDIFFLLDAASYHVDYVSPNIERLLGISLEEVQKNIRVMEKCTVTQNVVIPRDELEAIPLHGSKYYEYEYRHQSTGERRWYRMRVYHMEIQGIKKYIIVLSDRTAEQQMNQKLKEALDAAKSANEAKSNFLSNMSHDIRTPMNAIVGFSVLLDKDADKPDKVREYTGKIAAASQHLLNLINDVLDMSKIESGKTSLNVNLFSLPELLEELNIILTPQAKAKKQSFDIRVEGTPPQMLLGDKLRLNQILINLLSNAFKYTPDGGEINFTVCSLPAAPQYAKLRFIVKDNGIGMSEKFQKDIFSPFSREISSVTNAIQGTGLGMAITKNLVDLMGGIIRLESRLGEGSTFTVELSFLLPDTKEEKDWLDKKNTPASAADDGENVMEGRLFLIVEDNELNAEILTEMLHMEGAECELAVNGREAVEMFQNSAPGYYDMILMDVQMPVMNGYEATRQIHACGHPDAGTIPIVAMTANTFAEDVRNAMEAGMDGHLAKPIDMDLVIEMVGRLLRPKADADASADPENTVREGGDGK